MAFSEGHTMALAYNMDSLGKLYVSIATAWTVILLMGATFLVSRRDLPYLRIRNIPLALSAVATLHVYWVLCLIAYILQGHFPCAAEFWIMSIYLPLGIALFQACNTQLLHIATLQRKYTHNEIPYDDETRARDLPRWRRYLARFCVDNQVERAMAYIGYGMAVQVAITLLVFLVSYKFHEGFGLTAWDFSTAAEPVVCDKFITEYHAPTCTQAKKIACRKGWEWIPSIVWQVVWAWCYAPYLLWQLRDVRDVHGWRKQTVVCCVIGLFATPMWLCSLYVPGMAVVNRFYIPPMWFAPSIFLIEAFLIFVPCWQVIKNHRLRTETLDIIAEWEFKNNGSSIGTSTAETASRISRKPFTAIPAISRKGEMYTMTALESAIRTNPHPLLFFAAHKDFSGENISFLMKVLDWKRGWSPTSPTRIGFLRRPSISEINNKELQRQQFKGALDIYSACVSSKCSEYPINLSHVHLRELESIFEGAAMAVHGNVDHDDHSATPFDDAWPVSNTGSEDCPTSKDGASISSTQPVRELGNSTDHILGPVQNCKRRSILEAYEMIRVGDKLPENIPVPRGFGPEVFNRAEESIKYMVLTNTWPRFVKAQCANSSDRKPSFLKDLQERYLARRV